MKFFKKSQTQRKTNVLSPINWTVCFINALFFYGFLKGDHWAIQVTSLVLLVSLSIFYCYIYLFWAHRDPDRLQSEEFVLEQQNLYNQKEISALQANTKRTFTSSASEEKKTDDNA